ncbi:hypothetical protein FJW04_21920 [Mesorhizobium sp. B2-7-3]|uniref:hypothetical protein n=1 Tax=unclassified Mesorhizobium TaxID=325217 RepID=UPI001127B6E9|nr:MULTISPECIES: hypothetical protein [unclassified Mesorhizobium]MBZ9927758.1 hypothetical protein [Mesorhizobium sp. BR1-1-4]TPJ12917.1 hypothetical protein FJW04_21920 [Mesorhizobium sp. B2-7-3]
MIPNTFAAHWRRAIESGDASGFKDREDLVGFFTATGANTGAYDTFMKLTDDEKDHVVEMRSRYSGESLEAATRAHAKRSEAAQAIIAKNRANLGGGDPAVAAAAAKVPEKSKVSAWDRAIAATNEKLARGV